MPEPCCAEPHEPLGHSQNFAACSSQLWPARQTCGLSEQANADEVPEHQRPLPTCWTEVYAQRLLPCSTKVKLRQSFEEEPQESPSHLNWKQTKPSRSATAGALLYNVHWNGLWLWNRNGRIGNSIWLQKVIYLQPRQHSHAWESFSQRNGSRQRSITNAGSQCRSTSNMPLNEWL